MRIPLSDLSGKTFDVIVIGGGINGASATQHLVAAGYSVLLIDKGDFGSGSTSRSSRLLHCGLRYLAPGRSLLDFVIHPTRLVGALRMAKQAMEARSEFVTTAPRRVRSMKFCFPIYRDGPYRAWQVDLAFRILRMLGPNTVPLDYERVAPEQARHLPLAGWLHDPDRLKGVAVFREYQFDWPERICLDAVLDAERMGALVRNHTCARLLRFSSEGASAGVWSVGISDVLAPGSETLVHGKVIVNTAGIWIDAVNAEGSPRSRRRVLGTKGTHIMVRLPPECHDYGVATLNRDQEPFYCVPWRGGLHYLGPTETVYEGDLDDIRATEEEIAYLIAEANHLLPSARLTRASVVRTWAGVRPLTYDPSLPKGKRLREIHDLAADGLPNVLAMTAGPVMTYRSAGRELAKAVAKRLVPSQPVQSPSYEPRRFPENQNSPPLLDRDAEIKLSDLRYAAVHEHVATLADVLLRRSGVAWTHQLSSSELQNAGQAIAGDMGWDTERVEEEIAAFEAMMMRLHSADPKDDTEPETAEGSAVTTVERAIGIQASGAD